MLLSIITPTYNRACTLPRAFDSLVAQSCHGFEWIIVDDGSTDNTSQLCRAFSSEDFDIKYISKPNGGKHSAVNIGVSKAIGDFTLILDSDDSLPHDSVATILRYCEEIQDDFSFGGVAGYMAHHDGTIIGRGCERKVLDASPLEIRYQYGLKGDMAEVFRTSVLREFPFPVTEGERFCPESLIWFRIGDKYKLRYFPEVVYYRDYLEGGLTSKIVRIRMDSPIASTTYYKELNSYNIPFIERLKSAINYWRFWYCIPKGKVVPRLPYAWIWCRPLGYIIHLNDRDSR